MITFKQLMVKIRESTESDGPTVRLSRQSNGTTFLNNTKKLKSSKHFDIHHNEKKGVTHYIEKDDHKVPGHKLVYTYSHGKGNLTVGHGAQWARSELKSGSKAFHKDRPDKKAIPNDPKAAHKAVHDHYKQYKPRN